MPRPPEGYHALDGLPVPGITDVTALRNKPALPNWAYNRGKQGLPLYDRSLDVGTVAMAAIERWLRGQSNEQIAGYIRASLWRGSEDPTIEAQAEEAITQAETALEAFKGWARKVRLKVVALELSMVSEKYRYGGTLDIVAYVYEKLSIVEIKTCGDIPEEPYAEHKMQLAAQRQLWEEGRERPRITGGFYAVYLAKKTGKSRGFHYPQVRAAFRSFLAQLKVYEGEAELKALRPLPVRERPAPKPKRDILMLNGRARHARFERERAQLAFPFCYTVSTRVEFQTPAPIAVTVAPAAPAGDDLEARA